MKNKTSTVGIAFIKDFEGFSDKPYHCSAGVLTIFWGHTKTAKDYVGRNLSPSEAERIGEQLLKLDLLEFERAVDRLVKVSITQNQYDALISFVYNLGAGNFAKSKLLRKLNAGDYLGAAKQFKCWIYADGKKLKGLVKRRAAEAELFMLNNHISEPIGRAVLNNDLSGGVAHKATIIPPNLNNEPIPVRQLPLPTLQQHYGEPTVKNNSTTIVTAGASGLAASTIAILEYAPTILNALAGLQWQIAAILLVVGVGLAIWRFMDSN
jgi:lysozyme